MARSMTGYGRSEIESKNIYGYVEVKTKNHRHRDIKISLPGKLFAYEISLQKMITQKLLRGKIDFAVRIKSYLKPSFKLSLNKTLLQEYKKIFSELNSELGTAGAINLVDVAQLNDLIVMVEDEDAAKELFSEVESAAKLALDALCEMREFEGQRLVDEIKLFISAIEERVTTIEAKREKAIDGYCDTIRCKIQKLLNESNLDEQRLHQEIAYIIDKSDISEEITRLKSHLRHFDKIVMEDGSIGKKLDFLFQEINREINTIGSKANDFDILSQVIEVKNELEKAREQVQNIE